MDIHGYFAEKILEVIVSQYKIKPKYKDRIHNFITKYLKVCLHVFNENGKTKILLQDNRRNTYYYGSLADHKVVNAIITFTIKVIKERLPFAFTSSQKTEKEKRRSYYVQSL